MIAQLAEVGKTSSILELVGVILEYFWAGKGLLRVNKIRIFSFMTSLLINDSLKYVLNLTEGSIAT